MPAAPTSPVLALAFAAVLAVAACAAEDAAAPEPTASSQSPPPTPSTTAPPTSTPDEPPTTPDKGVRIPIVIDDGEVTPSGDRVDVAVGEPVLLVVSSDAADEIHVHSDPEHEFVISPRGKQVFEFTLARPGVVDVELHELEVTVVQLEAR